MARDWTKEYFNIKDDAPDDYVKLKKQVNIAKRAMNKAYKLLHNFAASEAQSVLQKAYFRIKKLEE